MNIDCITNHPIPEDRVVTIGNGDSLCVFDIYTLIRYFGQSGSYLNPFTKVPLPEAVIDRIKKFQEETLYKFTIRYTLASNAVNPIVSLNSHLSVMDLIIEVYRKHPYYNEPLSMIGYNPITLSKGKHLYDMDLSLPLYDVFTEKEVSLYVLSELNPCIRKGVGERKRKIYKYAYDNHMEWLINLIPERYQKDPPTPDNPNPLTFATLSTFLSHIDSKVIREKADIFRYGIAKLLEGTLISASDAHQMEELLMEKFYADKNEIWDKDPMKLIPTLHLLYSKVTDKFNLLPNKGIEGYYFVDRYDIKMSSYYSIH